MKWWRPPRDWWKVFESGGFFLCVFFLCVFFFFFIKWKRGSVSLKEGLFDLMSCCDRNMKQHVSVCVLNWNKQYFSETTFKSNVDIKPGRWIKSAQCYSRKKLDFLALQINKKNQYKIIYPKNKKGIKMYMVSCFLKKATFSITKI